MKTTILTFATIAALVLGNATYAATKNTSATKEVSTVLNNVSNINKIEIRGNVELYVSNGTSDQVKVYNHYYAESAVVQNQKGVLHITSYSSKKLVVWVTARDIQSITAYDNAAVKSFGKLSSINLDVQLHNSASAKLDLDAYSADVTVADHAKIDLSGFANDFTLNRAITTSVNKYNLTAVNYTENGSAAVYSNNMELAGL